MTAHRHQRRRPGELRQQWRRSRVDAPFSPCSGYPPV